jgi:hypothetical protein
MKLFVVLLLVCLPHLGFSQDVVAAGMETASGDEAALLELEKARDDRQKSVEAISAVSKNVFNPVEELEKLGHKDFDTAALFNPKALRVMERIFKEAKMHTLPPEVIRKQILDSFKGHPLESFIRGSPTLLNFFVDVMRDENALTSLLRIFQDKARLKIYLFLWIVIMLLAYFMRKLFISKHWGRFTRAFASLMFSVTISIISLSSFCLIFRPEMKPLISIIKRYF